MEVKKSKRYWEIDALRGFALLIMIFFHFFACLVSYHMIVETPEFLFFYQFFVVSTILFVGIAGVSLVLRHARKKGATRKSYYLSIVIKAAGLFALALGITGVTWLYAQCNMSEPAFILFGFLHMLSVSMIISLPFLWLGKWNLILGSFFVVIGYIPPISEIFPLGVNGLNSILPSLSGLGMTEYFPIFPWAGVLLLGVGVGTILYPNGIRRYEIRDCGAVGNFMAKLGLGYITIVIYTAHVPVIMFLLWIVSLITGVGHV